MKEFSIRKLKDYTFFLNDRSISKLSEIFVENKGQLFLKVLEKRSLCYELNE